VAVSTSQKAAMLLALLDAPAAAELLQSVRPDTATEIAAELACIRSATPDVAVQQQAVMEFWGLLTEGDGGQDAGQFVRQILKMSLGEERFDDVFRDVQRKVKMRDPFAKIRAAEVADILAAVRAESPQVIAMVVGELSTAKAAKLMSALPDETRSAVVQAMVSGQAVLPEARLKVATLIESRLAGPAAEGRIAADSEQIINAQTRRTALVLRCLDVKLREAMLGALKERDEKLAAKTVEMMVLWEDLPVVADRALQETLRNVDARKLALALYEADESVSEKIRRNISERANAMLSEEQSLLSKPKREDIEEARQSILKILREMNAKGELEFEGTDDSAAT